MGCRDPPANMLAGGERSACSTLEDCWAQTSIYPRSHKPRKRNSSPVSLLDVVVVFIGALCQIGGCRGCGAGTRSVRTGGYRLGESKVSKASTVAEGTKDRIRLLTLADLSWWLSSKRRRQLCGRGEAVRQARDQLACVSGSVV